MNIVQRLLLVIGVLAVALGLATAALPVDNRPVIGILTQPTEGDMGKHGADYIAASYIKFVEMAGARAVPINWRASKAELQHVFNNINGLLYPGGGTNLQGSKYTTQAKILWDMALAANDGTQMFPVWGTCMGFELMNILASGTSKVLTCGYDAENMTLPLVPTTAFAHSNMFKEAPHVVTSVLLQEPVTLNAHRCGVRPTDLNKYSQFFSILSTNVDRKGTPFVSAMEAKSVPFFGTQFHPEKPIFEWNPNEAMDHSHMSVVANSYFSPLFVSYARHNNHVLTDRSLLIYNYNVTYTAAEIPDFQQCYFFNFDN